MLRLSTEESVHLVQIVISDPIFVDLVVYLDKLLILVGRHGVDDRIVVEDRHLWVVVLDEANRWSVVRSQLNSTGSTVVEVRECYLVLSPDLVPHYDLVDVVELVPVLVLLVDVSVQGLELWPSRYCLVEGFCSVEALLVEEVKVVLVSEVGEQLAGEPVQVGHDRQGQPPAAVRGAVHQTCAAELEGLMVVEEIKDCIVFLLVEFHLDRLKRLAFEDVVAVVEGRLLVVEGREAHALEVTPISLLSPHHDPHRAPLGSVDRLDDLWGLIDESNGSCNVVQNLDGALLLPGHRHVLKELEYGMRHILQSSQVHSLVLPEPLRGHVTVVLDDFPQDFRGKQFFL